MGADPALGPFSSMHSKIAVTCVFEGEMQTAQATQVFLASNAEASGTLVLSMVCESVGNSANHKELWLYSLKPTSILSSQSTQPDSDTSFHVELVARLPCTAAARKDDSRPFMLQLARKGPSPRRRKRLGAGY
jgi:hypothetical protein